MLSKTAQEAFIGLEADGPRIITASSRTKNRRIRMDVIQCYAPTNESDEQVKEELKFCSRRLTIIQDHPRRNSIIRSGPKH